MEQMKLRLQVRFRHVAKVIFSRIKSKEHSEYSYIGLSDFFFQEKALKFVYAQF